MTPTAPVDLGSWRAESVGLGQVLDALGELRRTGQRTATRASVTNLVLVADTPEAVERACGAVHRTGRRHPGRNIVLLPRPDAGPAGIDAEVLLHGSGAAGPPVWSEDIRLEVRGAPAARLDSLVEPLTLADVPVAVWFVAGVPEPDDPLLRLAGTVLVDTGDAGAEGVAAVGRLARRHVVFDLCWARLRLWRQLLAGLFELPGCRPFLAGIEEVEASGGPATRLLLGGWVTSRLGLGPDRVRLEPAASPALRLVARHGGVTATFSVRAASGPGAGVVRASVEAGGTQPRVERVSLPDDPLSWSLAEALAHPGRDRAYGQALHAALVFVA